MSMPAITMSNNPVCMGQAISDMMESIALEEAALAHILNAEGEKLQKVLTLEGLTLQEVLEANTSVTDTLHAVDGLENTLKDKLEIISDNLYYPIRDNGEDI